MRVESTEVAWLELRFESKTQSHQTYSGEVKKILTIAGVSTGTLKVGIRKALEYSQCLSVIRNHNDLESSSRGGACRATPLWHHGGIDPTLEEVITLTRLPLCGDRSEMGVVLEEADEGNLQLLTLPY